VEFTVKDLSGKEIYHSGFLKPDGMLDPRAHSFTNRPVTDQGEFVDNHKVWTIHSVAYDNSVQAGRSVLVRYQFRMPAEAEGAVTVTAKVNYRHLRQSYLNNIFGKDHSAYPVVEIATRTRILKVGDNAPETPESSDNPDWMRWNNLGIALLDQFQYQESIQAFTEVIKLRPQYADAYTNVGLTEIVWEKYDSARTAIRKALSLDPGSARAAYYDGLLQRRAGNTEKEIAGFRKVVEMFPQLRDARRELGITYYQQNNNIAAVEQFEALPKIDPDDLTAHYNLSILYRRIGAAEQQSMFVDMKVDPGAPTYGLNYLREHPEISTESIPWHIHSDLLNRGGVLKMESKTNRMKGLLQVSRAALLSLCLTAVPGSALAANNCAWINEATASSLLGGDAVGQVSVPAAGQTTVCTFTSTSADAVRTLRVTVEIAADPHARMGELAQSCGASAAPLRAIGNEALTCAADDRKGDPGERLVGRVRDQVFTITIASTLKKDSTLTRDALESKIYLAAEQVAGNLF